MNDRYILIFDTETLNKQKDFSIYNNYIFDLGYVIYDKEKDIAVHENRFIIKEIFEDESLRENYFGGKEQLEKYYSIEELSKKNIYHADLGLQSTYIVSFKDVIKELKDKILYYSINSIAAYNIKFDLNALSATSKKLNVNIDFIDELEIIDIYHMACQALKGNELYITSCVEHGKVSPKGNISSNAEAVYCFITNDYNFIEEHTSLSDSRIETKIYSWVLDYEKQNDIVLDTSPYSSCWRYVQPKKVK